MISTEKFNKEHLSILSKIKGGKVMNLTKEILKSKAINLYCEIIIEENKTFGASIDYNKLEKIEHLFRRICKVLKNRYNTRVDIDINDNLIFIED